MIRHYRLFEDTDTESDDLHIYLDDATGDYYYFDGQSLIKIGNKPRVGDKGSEEIQRQEEENRRKQVEKEKQEKEENPDDYDDEDDGDDFNDETDEEKANRIKEIQSDLTNTRKQKAIDAELQKRKKEDEEKKEAERKEAERIKAGKWDDLDLPNAGLEGFKLDLKRFLKNEVDIAPERTYSKINKTYARSKILKPGLKRHSDSGKIPTIAVYFDQSGSWDSSDIQVGMQALKSLDKYVKEKKIKVDLWYFASRVSNTPSNLGNSTETPKVVDNIITTKPDNVIIMSDADGDWRGLVYDQTAIVPGCVWWLWRGRNSQRFRDHVIGRKGNKEFSI